MFRMFWYEIKMDFLRSIRYRFGMISDLLVYFALFTVFMVTDSGNSYAQTYHYGNYKELVLLGYVAWIYAISAISNVAGSLQSELIHGTLYKKVSSKYPLQYLFGGLYVSSVLLETITIVIVVIISKFVWGIEFSFHPAFLRACFPDKWRADGSPDAQSVPSQCALPSKFRVSVPEKPAISGSRRIRFPLSVRPVPSAALLQSSLENGTADYSAPA